MRIAKYVAGARKAYEEWISEDGSNFLTVTLVEPESHQKFCPYYLAAEVCVGTTLQVSEGETVLDALLGLSIDGWVAPTEEDLATLS